MDRAIDFIAIVPARRASTRLPDKPLADIAGKPMVVHVAERARESGARRVIVATDDADIATAVRGYGHEVAMTRASHASGTDRIAEVAHRLASDGEIGDDTLIVNVQGDEPMIDPTLIAQVAATLDSAAGCVIATAAHPITSLEDWTNPNVVKVVVDASGRALYFSRAPIPWNRDDPTNVPVDAMRHVGLYAYRTRFLATFTTLAACPLETVEALEQLRALWHGYGIAVFVSDRIPEAGVDTPEDLQRVRGRFERAAPGLPPG